MAKFKKNKIKKKLCVHFLEFNFVWNSFLINISLEILIFNIRPSQKSRLFWNLLFFKYSLELNYNTYIDDDDDDERTIAR